MLQAAGSRGRSAIFHLFFHRDTMRSRTFIRLILLLLLSFTLSTTAFAAPKKKSVSAKETITYVVKKGDTVDKIAKKYEVRVQDIAR